jgi:hypothetical protein
MNKLYDGLAELDSIYVQEIFRLDNEVQLVWFIYL